MLTEKQEKRWIRSRTKYTAWGLASACDGLSTDARRGARAYFSEHAFQPRSSLRGQSAHELQLLSGAACVSAPAFQRHYTLRVFAKSRAVVRPGSCHTLTGVFRAFLRICHGCSSVFTSYMGDALARRWDVQRLAASRFSACRRLVSVSTAPLSMRATSCTRSPSCMRTTSVRVRPRDSVLRSTKC